MDIYIFIYLFFFFWRNKNKYFSVLDENSALNGASI